MSQNQQQQPSKSPPPKKEDPFAKFIALGMQLGIILSIVCIGMQYFFTTGDEVNCGAGIGSNAQACFLPGWELDTLVIVTGSLLMILLIGIGFWQKSNK